MPAAGQPLTAARLLVVCYAGDVRVPLMGALLGGAGTSPAPTRLGTKSDSTRFVHLSYGYKSPRAARAPLAKGGGGDFADKRRCQCANVMHFGLVQLQSPSEVFKGALARVVQRRRFFASRSCTKVFPVSQKNKAALRFIPTAV